MGGGTAQPRALSAPCMQRARVHSSRAQQQAATFAACAPRPLTSSMTLLEGVSSRCSRGASLPAAATATNCARSMPPSHCLNPPS